MSDVVIQQPQEQSQLETSGGSFAALIRTVMVGEVAILLLQLLWETVWELVKS